MSIKTQEDRVKFSRKRKKLIDIIQELKSVSGVFMSDKPVIKGYVYELKTKCGKKTCACARGAFHYRWVVSEIKEVGRQLRVIPKGEVVEMKIMAERYRKIRKARLVKKIVSERRIIFFCHTFASKKFHRFDIKSKNEVFRWISWMRARTDYKFIVAPCSEVRVTDYI